MRFFIASLFPLALFVATVTVAAPFTCVLIDDPVTNDVTNNNTVGDPGIDYVPFWVKDTVGGKLIRRHCRAVAGGDCSRRRGGHGFLG